jgi:zinc ribbon protein
VSNETCSQCGTELPAEARFCPSCGSRTEVDRSTREEVVPKPETGPVPVDIVELEPHFFGIPPPLLTFVLASGALVGAVVLFILERFVFGALLLSLSLALFALFLWVIRRRRPTTPFAVGSVRLLDRISAGGSYIFASILAWSRVRRELLRRRQESAELSSRREREQLALGEAAYRQDRKEIAARRAAMQAIDDRLLELERETRAIIERTRADLRDEHVAARPTETITPERAEAEGEDEKPR